MIWTFHWIWISQKFCCRLVKVKLDDNFLNTVHHFSCKLQLNYLSSAPVETGNCLNILESYIRVVCKLCYKLCLQIFNMRVLIWSGGERLPNPEPVKHWLWNFLWMWCQIRSFKKLENSNQDHISRWSLKLCISMNKSYSPDIIIQD